MECTGRYHESMANSLSNAGFFVTVVNPHLIKNFGNNTSVSYTHLDVYKRQVYISLTAVSGIIADCIIIIYKIRGELILAKGSKENFSL